MIDNDFHSELIVKMLGQMLGTIRTAMLATRTAERKHQARETTLDITLHMMVGQPIYAFQELKDFAVVLKEADNRFVKSGQLLVRFVAAGIVGAATVEHVATTIAGRVFRNTGTPSPPSSRHHVDFG